MTPERSTQKTSKSFWRRKRQKVERGPGKILKFY